MAGVGELFGVSRWVSIPVTVAFLLGLAFTGSYRRVERIGIAIGLAELTFIPAMILAHPSGHDLLHGLATLPLGHKSYVYLLAANVGAVIMPWMIFYQQSAIVDKGLQPSMLRAERRDTAVGAVITQGIMIVVIVAFAATIFKVNRGAALNTVGQLAGALGPYIGGTSSRVLIGAAILNERISRRNAKFYLVYGLAHVLGAILVLASVNLVRLAVDVEVMNALLLPIVLGFLLVLERKALPPEHRMHGTYRAACTTLCLIVIGFGLYMAPATLGWT